jgi:hypothetical protein
LKETKSGSNPLPLAQAVLEVPRLWREHTPYRSNEDWIFASPYYHGKTPYTYRILFRRHIRPVIERVSGLKSSKEAPIGWHTLRRSLATVLISNGENVKVSQSQLRHPTPKITLELYAQAVSADQQKAHKKLVRMVLPLTFPLEDLIALVDGRAELVKEIHSAPKTCAPISLQKSRKCSQPQPLWMHYPDICALMRRARFASRYCWSV